MAVNTVNRLHPRRRNTMIKDSLKQDFIEKNTLVFKIPWYCRLQAETVRGYSERVEKYEDQERPEEGLHVEREEEHDGHCWPEEGPHVGRVGEHDGRGWRDLMLNAMKGMMIKVGRKKDLMLNLMKSTTSNVGWTNEVMLIEMMNKVCR